MSDFALDRTGLIFYSFSLAVTCFAVLDTRRFLWLLSYGRKTTFSKFALMVIRVPGTVVILGSTWLILSTLWRNH